MLGMAPTFVFFCILASLYFSGQADLLNTPKHQRRVNDDTELFSDEESAYAHASTVSGGASEGSTVETMYVHGLIPASIVCVRCVRMRACACACVCIFCLSLSVSLSVSLSLAFVLSPVSLFIYDCKHGRITTNE